jgi:hypothetical protein
MPFARPIVVSLTIAALLASCARTLNTSVQAGTGTLAIELTDAPFLVAHVRSVDVFVVRVDARLTDADSSAAARGAPDDSAGHGGWKAIASPYVRVNLLDYQYHVALPLGDARVPAGTYRGFRLVIDPTRSSLTLADGTVLTSTSVPNVGYPDVDRLGITVFVAKPVTISEGRTTTLRVDFAVDESFVLRGATIAEKGLVFRPVLRAAVQPRPSN